MSKGSSNVEFEKSLILKGWVKGPDGNLSHPARAASIGLGGLESSQRIESTRPLERTVQAKQSGEGVMVDSGAGSVRKPSVRRRSYANSKSVNPIVTVTFICFRHKFIDGDNLGNGFKALQDAVANWIGVDDGDPRVEWIYRQQVGPKPHGTIVMVTTKKKRTWKQ